MMVQVGMVFYLELHGLKDTKKIQMKDLLPVHWPRHHEDIFLAISPLTQFNLYRIKGKLIQGLF